MSTASRSPGSARTSTRSWPLLAPLWWLWPDPELLLVVQAVAVASGALPVFWLARKHLDAEWPAAALALAYLLYPPVQWLTMSDFHPVALACPLLLFAWWHLDERRLWAFALLAAAAIATKEHVGLAVAAIGVWYAVRYRAPRTGAAIAVGAAPRPRRDARRRAPLRAGRILGVREPLRLAVARRARPRPTSPRCSSRSRCCRSPRRSRCSPRVPELGLNLLSSTRHADLRQDALRGRGDAGAPRRGGLRRRAARLAARVRRAC